jgi:flagellar secretion chaperone FliS
VPAYARNPKLAAYQSVSVQGAVAGADPHSLILMLMDGALERMLTAQRCLERGELTKKAKLLHSCVTLIAELRGSLDMQRGESLAQNLSDLYEYMIRRLLLANAGNDINCLKQVYDLLREIRSAWAAIGPEVRRQAAAGAAAAPEAASPQLGTTRGAAR